MALAVVVCVLFNCECSWVMVIFAFLAAWILSSCFAAPLPSSNLPVCIVGGGIAGASTAYFLHESGVADVLLVERESRLGGRLLSALVDSVRVDVGGDAWMDANENMMHLMKTLPIQLSNENYNGNGKTAIFDGRRLFPASKFEPVAAAEIVATLELLKLRLRENYETFSSSSFDSIQGYANAHLSPYLRDSSRAFAERWLAHSDFFTLFQWEPLTRTIYDQNLNVTLFAGLVALLSTQRSYTCANGLFINVFLYLNLKRKKKKQIQQEMIGLFGSLLSKAKVFVTLLYFSHKKKKTNKLVCCSAQTLGPLRTPLLWMFTAILFLAALLSWLLRPSK